MSWMSWDLVCSLLLLALENETTNTTTSMTNHDNDNEHVLLYPLKPACIRLRPLCVFWPLFEKTVHPGMVFKPQARIHTACGPSLNSITAPGWSLAVDFSTRVRRVFDFWHENYLHSICYLLQPFCSNKERLTSDIRHSNTTRNPCQFSVITIYRRRILAVSWTSCQITVPPSERTSSQLSDGCPCSLRQASWLIGCCEHTWTCWVWRAAECPEGPAAVFVTMVGIPPKTWWGQAREFGESEWSQRL